MNIVYYKGHDYFNYMKYYEPNDFNIFIGGRGTGKTFSILHYKCVGEIEEFEYHVGESGSKYFLIRNYNKKGILVPLEQPFIRLQYGAVYTFISMKDFLSVNGRYFRMRSPTQLNKLINRIKSEGWTYPTEYAYVSDAFARIVIPSGRKGAGTIRTMKQANEYLTKKYGSEAILFTQQEYDEELTNLRSVLEGRLTYRNFMREERINMISIIEEAMDKTGRFIDYRNISNEKMKEAIENAHRDSIKDSRGSPQFYEYLMSYLA